VILGWGRGRSSCANDTLLGESGSLLERRGKPWSPPSGGEREGTNLAVRVDVRESGEVAGLGNAVTLLFPRACLSSSAASV